MKQTVLSINLFWSDIVMNQGTRTAAKWASSGARAGSAWRGPWCATTAASAGTQFNGLFGNLWNNISVKFLIFRQFFGPIFKVN